MKKSLSIAEILAIKLFIRSYPILLGNFDLTFFLAQPPPHAPMKFFLRWSFFLFHSQHFKLRSQHFYVFLPIFNFVPHEFFSKKRPNLDHFTLYIYGQPGGQILQFCPKWTKILDIQLILSIYLHINIGKWA